MKNLKTLLGVCMLLCASISIGQARAILPISDFQDNLSELSIVAETPVAYTLVVVGCLKYRRDGTMYCKGKK